MVGKTVTVLRVDAEFKNLLPPLRPDELEGLEASLKSDGWRDGERIYEWDGVIVDGHNRYEICSRCNIPFKTFTLSFTDRLAALIWIRSNQRNRRNLTDDQRAMNAAALAELMSEREKRERASKAGKEGGNGRAKDQSSLRDDVTRKLPKVSKSRVAAARSSRVSERKVKQAQAVRKSAPALAKKVEAGEITLAEAKAIAAKANGAKGGRPKKKKEPDE